MAISMRSPRVVGSHFYAKYGYDEALRQVSMKLTQNQDEGFWKKVVDVLDEMRADEICGKHPCAAIPPEPLIKKPARRALNRRPS